MSIQGRGAGSRIRHINGENLVDLQNTLESLSYKTSIIQIHKVSNDWFIHFYIPDLLDEPLLTKTSMAEPTKTKTKRIRRK